MAQLSKLAQTLKDEKPPLAPAAPPLVVQPPLDLTALLQTNPDLLLKLLQQQQQLT